MSDADIVSLAFGTNALQKLTVPLERRPRQTPMSARAAQGTSTTQLLIHLSSHSRERLNIFKRGRCGLFVLLYEIPVRVHLKQGLFTVRFDEHLVIPLTIGIVFPYYLNDLSACRLFVNCLLDRFGERL